MATGACQPPDPPPAASTDGDAAGLLAQYRHALGVLGATEAALRELIDRNADGVLVVRPDGVIRFANRAAERFLNRTRAELIGQPFGRPVVPGETTEIDLVRHGPAGGGRTQVMTAEMRCVPVLWEGEAALLASLHDITQHKRAEEELRFLVEASRELTGSLDEPTVMACVVRLAASHLCDWCVLDRVPDGDGGPNVRVYATAPYDDALAARLRSAQDRGAEADRPDAVRRVLSTGQACGGPAAEGLPVAAVGPGEVPPLVEAMAAGSFLCVPLVKGGHVIGALTLAWQAAGRLPEPADVSLAETFARRAADALSNARLYHTTRQENHRKAEFLAMLGHELRNPLAAVRAAAALLAPAGTDAPAAVIERQVAHMGRLIDDLLEVSRLTRGRIALRREPTDLAAVVRSAVQTCGPILTERRHELVLELPGGPLVLEGDGHRLQQVVANLVHNAAKYTDPGGRVCVSAERQAGELVLRVRDNGPGVSPEMMPRLFDLFISGPQALDRPAGGLGIGLSLVKGLVELHGGTVTAFSEGEGKGSLFEVRLPAGPGTLALPEVPAADAAAPVPAGGRRRVLLVEDNADNRVMLGELLRVWGHEVEVAADGLTGLVKATTGWADVALVDIGLPGCTGYQLAEQVRAHESRLPDRPPLRMIAMTGYGHPDDKRQALASGFDLHLVKPLDPAELGRLIRAGGGPGA